LGERIVKDCTGTMIVKEEWKKRREYKYVYPSTDKYRMNIGRRRDRWEGRGEEDWKGKRRGDGEEQKKSIV